jgi:hypothetical protein
VCALLRWQPPLIALCTVGLPLVFLTYLRLSDVYHDLPVRTVMVTALLAVGLGVGWALLTGPIIAHSYDVTLLSGMTGGRALWQRLAIPLGGAVLMLVPVTLARMSRPAIRESLDGFVIGAVGAILFTAAATLTRLAPNWRPGWSPTTAHQFTPHRGGHPRFGGAVDRGGRGRHGRRGALVQAPS